MVICDFRVVWILIMKVFNRKACFHEVCKKHTLHTVFDTLFRRPIYHIIVYPFIMNAIFRIESYSAHLSNPVQAGSIIIVRNRFWCRWKSQIQSFQSALNHFTWIIDNIRTWSEKGFIFPRIVFFRKNRIHDNLVCGNAVYLSSDTCNIADIFRDHNEPPNKNNSGADRKLWICAFHWHQNWFCVKIIERARTGSEKCA